MLLRDLRPAEGDELIEHRLRVAHTSISHASDSHSGFFGEAHPLILSDMHQMLRDDFSRDGAQVKTLTARENGGENLMRLCRCEDELRVRWGLFQCLEQSIEGFLRQHMNLIDVDDAKLSTSGGKLHAITEVADIINTAVGSTIDFEYF